MFVRSASVDFTSISYFHFVLSEQLATHLLNKMKRRSFLLSFLMLFSLFDFASSGPVAGGACAAACTVALGSCHVAATMSAMVGRADYSEAKKACDVIFATCTVGCSALFLSPTP
ncbi:hypothetical protein M3Y94_00710100 [Aphelenchoides besseyi]|nr:hypothetical protein M3Y94_00710100 [Aphelenchoides besseyi]